MLILAMLPARNPAETALITKVFFYISIESSLGAFDSGFCPNLLFLVYLAARDARWSDTPLDAPSFFSYYSYLAPLLLKNSLTT